MKTFRLISLGILAILIGCTFTACSDDDNDDKVENNPFVGVWKKDYSKIEYKSDGTWCEYNNYYSEVSDANVWKDTGSYSYDEASRTLAIKRDRTGLTYIYYIQHISKNKIIYYYAGHESDPDYVYTLERIN